eukprot:TRINITY_DN12498_c0_g2_i1.p1 TRINITY_DN12498_c0_g2~~TRINITY_DN12498_c0_g2_i1.p1  ORF type:complete len:1456 (-),score=215.52 TRINITY_DN12498_c0_g2_i1:74-3796(-)
MSHPEPESRVLSVQREASQPQDDDSVNSIDPAQAGTGFCKRSPISSANSAKFIQRCMSNGKPESEIKATCDQQHQQLFELGTDTTLWIPGENHCRDEKRSGHHQDEVQNDIPEPTPTPPSTALDDGSVYAARESSVMSEQHPAWPSCEKHQANSTGACHSDTGMRLRQRGSDSDSEDWPTPPASPRIEVSTETKPDRWKVSGTADNAKVSERRRIEAVSTETKADRLKASEIAAPRVEVSLETKADRWKASETAASQIEVLLDTKADNAKVSEAETSGLDTCIDRDLSSNCPTSIDRCSFDTQCSTKPLASPDESVHSPDTSQAGMCPYEFSFAAHARSLISHASSPPPLSHVSALDSSGISWPGSSDESSVAATEHVATGQKAASSCSSLSFDKERSHLEEDRRLVESHELRTHGKPNTRHMLRKRVKAFNPAPNNLTDRSTPSQSSSMQQRAQPGAQTFNQTPRGWEKQLLQMIQHRPEPCKDSRTSNDEQCASPTKGKLSTFERSQAWAMQKEERLERLREMQLRLARGESLVGSEDCSSKPVHKSMKRSSSFGTFAGAKCAGVDASRSLLRALASPARVTAASNSRGNIFGLDSSPKAILRDSGHRRHLSSVICSTGQEVDASQTSEASNISDASKRECNDDNTMLSSNASVGFPCKSPRSPSVSKEHPRISNSAFQRILSRDQGSAQGRQASGEMRSPRSLSPMPRMVSQSSALQASHSRSPRSLSPRASSLRSTSTGPASLHTRGEAWLQRKRSRERELREEAKRQEVVECTFQPATLSSLSETLPYAATAGAAPAASRENTPRRSVTPERARLMFERQLTWRQRLDDESDRRRQEQREREEREVQACRRAASAGPSLRRRSQTPRRHPPDADAAFASFHERNQQWQRDREARWEKRHDNIVHNKTCVAASPSQRARSLQPRSASAGATPPHSPRELGKNSQHVPRSFLDPELPSCAVLIPTPAEPDVGMHVQASRSETRLRRGSANEGCRSSCHMPHTAPGKPVRATVPASVLVATESQCRSSVWRSQQNDSESSGGFGTNKSLCSGVCKSGEEGHESLPSSDGERSEVINQLRALRQCLVSSKARHQDSAGWQKALRVEAARLRGAGAAPLRSAHQRSSSTSSCPAVSLQELSSIQAAAQAGAQPLSFVKEAGEKDSQSTGPGRSRQRNRSCDSGHRYSQSPSRSAATYVRGRSRGSSPRGHRNPSGAGVTPVVSVNVGAPVQYLSSRKVSL